MKWKHHGYLLAQRAVNPLIVHIVLHELLSGLLFTVHCRKYLKKLFKILNEQDPNCFFCLFYWNYGLCTTYHVFFLFVCFVLFCFFVVVLFCFFSFSTLAHKVNEPWKWHKIENFDPWSQFTSCTNEGPSSLHWHLIGICFLVVSLFM